MVRPNRSRGERTRRAILDGAYRLIIKQGFAATSMREIAVQSHVALGGIYNHFGSKEEVFRAIVEERHPFVHILPVLQSVEGETLEDFFRNAARTLVEELRRHPDFLNLMLIEIVEFKARHVPGLFRKFLPLAVPLVQRLAPLRSENARHPAHDPCTGVPWHVLLILHHGSPAWPFFARRHVRGRHGSLRGHLSAWRA